MGSTYCSACGSAQANHRSLWFSSTGDIITFRFPFESLPFHNVLLRLGDWVAGLLGRAGFWFGRLVGLITLSNDTGKTVSNRSKLLWEEAARRDIEMRQLLFFGMPTDTFRVRSGRASYFFKSLPLASSGSELRMDDKVFFKKTLQEAGLPVPRSRSVSNLKEARQALSEFETVCVKPRTGSNGRHTYPHVRTEEELERALQSVQEICRYASVEEHLEGNLCRATCIDGKLIGFLESKYPTVVGDGVSTVSELVDRLNANRDKGVAEILLNDHYADYISRRGYGLDSVLPDGLSLPLSYRAGASSGGSNREHGLTIHPSFVPPIEEAARLTGLPIVGFDLIIPDAFAPAEGQRWGFIEANSLPWIDLHATPYSGDPIDLSRAVWELWSRRGTR